MIQLNVDDPQPNSIPRFLLNDRFFGYHLPPILDPGRRVVGVVALGAVQSISG